jgi:dolichyl-phosphate mannosyltransferase polypeptide 2 regulatory subunit
MRKDLGRPLHTGFLLLVATVVFVYYTMWTLILVRAPLPLRMPARADLLIRAQPFLDADSPLQAGFPDRVWAVRLPVALLLVGLAGIAAFIGAVLARSARAKRARPLTGSNVKRAA